MQLPILPAGVKSIAEDPPTLQALYLLFGVLLAILPLAHVTALRNSLIGLIALLALLQIRRVSWKNIPGLVPWIVWLAFAAASIAWSALPDASFQSFRNDQFYPFIIFMVSFMLVRSLGGRVAVASGTAAGTLLCLAAMFAAAALNVDPDASAPEPGVMGWLAWKAGNTTDASTYVAYVAVPLFLILLTSRHAWRRWSAAVWLLLFAAIGFLSESRTLVATLFVSFVGFLTALGILRGRLPGNHFARAHGRPAVEQPERCDRDDHGRSAAGDVGRVSRAREKAPLARHRVGTYGTLAGLSPAR